MEEKIQFGILHNRKTGGTALKAIIAAQTKIKPLSHVMCFDHAMTFPLFIKQYPDASAIFFMREPLSRFVSGFYSRLRQGQPRYHHPWSSKESRAFHYFQTPNELAENLSSLNVMKRYLAIAAMKSIGHVRHTYVNFFGSTDFLIAHQHRIAYIGHQPEFDTDLERLRILLTLDESVQPPQDDQDAHRNPKDLDLALSFQAKKNLLRWYQSDIDLYLWCLTHRSMIVLTNFS